MKRKGFSTVGIVAVVLIVAALCVATFAIINSKSNAEYTGYDSAMIIEANDNNGQIADHVKGNATAPVTIVEYINYGCSHCADMTVLMEEILEKSNGQLALVVRNVPNSGFPNSKAAAAAAEAAGLQGYWNDYATKLMEQQAEWAGVNSDERTGLFVKYFEEVTDGQGNIEQFKSDMESDVVAAKLKFDEAMGDIDGVTGTPSFYISGQKIDLANGGELTVDGQTVKYEPVEDVEGYLTLIGNVAKVKTGNGGNATEEIVVETENAEENATEGNATEGNATGENAE